MALPQVNLKTLTGHINEVHAVAFSPDGTKIITDGLGGLDRKPCSLLSEPRFIGLWDYHDFGKRAILIIIKIPQIMVQKIFAVRQTNLPLLDQALSESRTGCA